MPVQVNILNEAQSAELLQNAKHGDMFFKSGGIRSGAVFFVQALNATGGQTSKILIQSDETGSGYCSIPIAITRHFDDPVKEFLPLLENKKAGVRKTDWHTIEIDTVKHIKIITEATKGKTVSEGRRVVYFVSGNEAPGYYIFNPDTINDNINFWKKLNATIDEKYLQSEIYYLTEADIETIRNKNKKIVETKFIKWLEQQNTELPLFIENLPDDINHKENTITQNQTVHFLNTEQKNGLTLVNTRMREYTDWNEKGERNFIDLDLTFEPKYLSETGQWGKILFWVNVQKDVYLIAPTWDQGFKKFK